MNKQVAFVLGLLFMTSVVFASSVAYDDCYDCCTGCNDVEYHVDYGDVDEDYYWAKDYYVSHDYRKTQKKEYHYEVNNNYRVDHNYHTYDHFYGYDHKKLVIPHTTYYSKPKHHYGWDNSYETHYKKKRYDSGFNHKFVEYHDHEPSYVFVEKHDYKLRYSPVYDRHYVTKCHQYPPSRWSFIYRAC